MFKEERGLHYREMLLRLLLVFICFNSISSDGGIPENRGLNWYESLPAVAMDYKVHIDAGKGQRR